MLRVSLLRKAAGRPPYAAAETPLTSVQIASRHGVNPVPRMQLVDYLQRSNGAAIRLSSMHGKRRGTERHPRNRLGLRPLSPKLVCRSTAENVSEALAARYEALFRQALKEGTGLRAIRPQGALRVSSPRSSARSALPIMPGDTMPPTVREQLTKTGRGAAEPRKSDAGVSARHGHLRKRCDR